VESKDRPLKAVIAGLEKRPEKLMKVNRADLFDSADRIDLAHGALLFSIRERVRRAKGVLARLEEIGAKDGLITRTSVNWDALEKWTDERLIETGTERVREDCFSYEVFQK